MTTRKSFSHWSCLVVVLALYLVFPELTLGQEGLVRDTSVPTALPVNTFDPSVAAGTEGQPTEVERREVFVQRVLRRLQEAEVPEDKLRAIMDAYGNWLDEGRREELWADVSDAVAAAAFRKNVSSEVTVLTVPEPGAMVKYQLVGERRRSEEPRSMGATEITKSLTVGDYYIWAERDGIETTSRDEWFEIIEPEELVRLAEAIGNDGP